MRWHFCCCGVPAVWGCCVNGAQAFGGLLVGMYPLVIIGYNLAFRLMMLPVGQPMRPAG